MTDEVPIEIPTKIWGRKFWNMLFFNVFAYPDQPSERQSQRFQNFLESLCLPCPECQSKYDNYLKEHPVTFDTTQSRNKLIRWVWDLRNHERAERNEAPFEFSHTLDNFSRYHGLHFVSKHEHCATCKHLLRGCDSDLPN